MEWSIEPPFHHLLDLAITQGIAHVPAHVPSDNVGLSQWVVVKSPQLTIGSLRLSAGSEGDNAPVARSFAVSGWIQFRPPTSAPQPSPPGNGRTVALLSQTPPAACPPTEDRPTHTGASSQHPLGALQQSAQHAHPIIYEPAIRSSFRPSCHPPTACGPTIPAANPPMPPHDG